jgi:hypothetical protein
MNNKARMLFYFDNNSLLYQNGNQDRCRHHRNFIIETKDYWEFENHWVEPAGIDTVGYSRRKQMYIELI